MKNKLLIAVLSLFSSLTFAQQTQVKDNELVYMKTDQGLIIYQLLPHVAPNHSVRFANLVEEGFYDGLSFYRVINGFVAQAGDEGGENGKASKFKSPLKAELTREMTADSNFKVIQSPELLAPETGFIHSIPAGRDPKTKEEWLLHCPGTVSMARGTEADSGTTEFYINIGQAPRHLDRNMSTFARVVYGLDVAQRMTRGDVKKGGMITDKEKRTKIIWAKMGDKVAAELKKTVRVDQVDSDAFQAKLSSAKHMTNPFYVYPGSGNIDVCYHQPKVHVE